MLADMLLEMNRPVAALAEYEKSMKTDPDRFNGLYGSGRSAELTGDLEKAQRYYQQLLKNCGTGRSRRAEWRHAEEILKVSVGG